MIAHKQKELPGRGAQIAQQTHEGACIVPPAGAAKLEAPKKPFHPLAQFAIDYALIHGGIDRTLLAGELSGSSWVRGAGKAYFTVARDVLGTLVFDGIMVPDALGWYRLVPGYVGEVAS